ncbi:MAG: sulfotransferase [Trichodesmium sp. MAG_R02]|jgi:hypothetical protein|nr:sulfotransferase [Trichodesmium sp. MAG_R02]
MNTIKIISKIKQLISQSFKEQYGFLVHPKRTYKMITSRVHPEPIFILGEAKSGTTAIASLLSQVSGQQVTIDLIYRIKRSPKAHILNKLYSRELPFHDFVQAYKFYFSTPLNKCPNFVSFYDELCSCFPKAKFIFIVRDPRDNIRSLLNRRKVPGNLKSFPGKEYYQLKSFTDRSLAGNNYIEKMAHHWNLTVQKYIDHENNMVLIRYEDFMLDKVGSISNLAKQVGLNPINDITEYLDIQYQPRGNREISWQDFFGQTNLGSIEAICGERMDYFGYSC